MFKKTLIVATAFLICAAVGAGSLSALGSCATGWALEEACVLCLPGFEPRPNGTTGAAPTNYTCYSCYAVGGGGGGNGGGDGGDDGDSRPKMCLSPVKPIGIGVLQIGDALQIEDLGGLGRVSKEEAVSAPVSTES